MRRKQAERDEPSLRIIKPITEAQERYIGSIKSKTITFGTGPAGTGKSFVAVAMAAYALINRDTSQIIVTRPVVDAGNTLGFLPGELDEKFAPYIAPITDAFSAIMGKSQMEYAFKVGRIKAIPLELMRGLDIRHSWIILDEAQNTLPRQMKLFLTRIGEGTKAIVNGDEDQSDLPPGCTSGLVDAASRFADANDFPEINTVRFEDTDIVRSGIVREVLRGYRS